MVSEWGWRHASDVRGQAVCSCVPICPAVEGVHCKPVQGKPEPWPLTTVPTPVGHTEWQLESVSSLLEGRLYADSLRCQGDEGVSEAPLSCSKEAVLQQHRWRVAVKCVCVLGIVWVLWKHTGRLTSWDMVCCDLGERTLASHDPSLLPRK